MIADTNALWSEFDSVKSENKHAAHTLTLHLTDLSPIIFTSRAWKCGNRNYVSHFKCGYAILLLFQMTNAFRETSSFVWSDHYE